MGSSTELAARLERIATGDRAALSALYDEVAPRMLGLAQKMLRDHSEAEEVMMDAFTQIWRQAGRYDSGRSDAVTWILMLTRSRALDRLRRRRGSPEREADLAQLPEIASREERPDEAVGRSERSELVRDAVAALSPEQRAAVEAVYFQGLNHSEVAAAHRLPLGTVKTRVRSGLLALRQQLGEARPGIS